ncbi:hypothetical protein AXG93_1633s1020 [Marchantia polymorpha subsp. ruderalis]|uniref:Uncharacterized protein n=1 Tax=Marchantia polymorpha subsp. ruderalis TaxID=1480154 RepID=A0A176VST4_MARPO|nr:hypothetical protein AXG93_1633s1020 [Marchantia polymorpha subsp. ruderalis]
MSQVLSTKFLRKSPEVVIAVERLGKDCHSHVTQRPLQPQGRGLEEILEPHVQHPPIDRPMPLDALVAIAADALANLPPENKPFDDLPLGQRAREAG